MLAGAEDLYHVAAGLSEVDNRFLPDGVICQLAYRGPPGIAAMAVSESGGVYASGGAEQGHNLPGGLRIVDIRINSYQAIVPRPDAKSGIRVPAPGVELLDICFRGGCPSGNPDQLACGVFHGWQFPRGFDAGLRGKGGFRVAFYRQYPRG